MERNIIFVVGSEFGVVDEGLDSCYTSVIHWTGQISMQSMSDSSRLRQRHFSVYRNDKCLILYICTPRAAID